MPKSETVTLKIQVHCDECIRKVKKAIAQIDGVESIVFDAKLKKVTVTGDIDSQKVLKKVKKTGKHVELLEPAKGFKELKGFDPKDFTKMVGAFDNRKEDSDKKKADSDKKKVDFDRNKGPSDKKKDNSDLRKATSDSKLKDESDKKKMAEPTFIKQEFGNKMEGAHKVKQEVFSLDHNIHSIRDKPNLTYSYAHNDMTFMFSEDNPQNCSIM